MADIVDTTTRAPRKPGGLGLSAEAANVYAWWTLGGPLDVPRAGRAHPWRYDRPRRLWACRCGAVQEV